MDHLKLTIDSLSVDAISNLVVDDSCGAVSIFVGTTRDNFEGKKVVRLEYEAYEPMALKAMKAICDEIRDKWPSVHGIAMYHRLGEVPARESSVVIAISSPHRQESLQAVSHCIDALKARVPIWKKEVYDGAAPQWKENKECPAPQQTRQVVAPGPVDRDLVQINVSNEELQKRIHNFIERKREQINISNVHDFIPSSRACTDESVDEETCARVRTQFVKRTDSKGHLKVRKVHNEWGPQTASRAIKREPDRHADDVPNSIAERVDAVEKFLGITPSAVPKDVYKRLKEMEDKIAELQAISPEYKMFWNNARSSSDIAKDKKTKDYVYSADDIAKKIEMLEKHAS